VPGALVLLARIAQADDQEGAIGTVPGVAAIAISGPAE